MATKYFCIGVFDIADGPTTGPIHGLSASGLLGTAHYANKILDFSSANLADKVAMAAGVVADINSSAVTPAAATAGVTSVRAVHSPDSTIVAIAMWTTVNIPGRMQLLSGPATSPFDIHQGRTGVTNAIPANVANPAHTFDLLSGLIGVGVGALAVRS